MASSFLVLTVFILLGNPFLSKSAYSAGENGLCAYKEFPCESGECVDRTAWCDGPDDCPDNSDEKYCRTADPFGENSDVNDCASDDRYFRCQNGMCIPKVGRCNDMPDCQDGEDEENCEYLYDDLESSSLARSDGIPTTSTLPSSTVHTGYGFNEKTAAFSSACDDLTRMRFDVLHKSLRHVMEGRDVTWGWGKATPRITTALYLANASYFDPNNYDGLLTMKQLEVQLALDLMRHHERPLRTTDLAHYVHALVASCSNPRDFHGVNVLKMLKKSMVRRQSEGLFVSPLAHLALCNAGDMPGDMYIRRIKSMAYRRNDEPRWLDVQAYALLAISCKAMRDGTEKWLQLRRDVAKNISEWQQQNGGFGSIHSTALVLQALISAREAGTESVQSRAMSHLLLNQDFQGSYGNEMDNYYVLPALNLKSLAHLHQRTCYNDQLPQKTEASKEKKDHHLNKKLVVHFSVWMGDNEIQTVTVSLPRHSDFLKVMETAEKINPVFKHDLLSTGRGTTSVHSIAGQSSDIETGTYWTLYRRVPLPFRPKLSNVTATVARLKLLGAKRWHKDIRKLHPKDGEHLVFWYKPHL